MKTICIIQARMGSTRLPGKILMDIEGKPMLQHIVERVRKCQNVDEIVVATTTKEEDKRVSELCNKINCRCFEGSEEDVLDRYYKAAIHYGAKIIIRVTGDCPLADFNQIDRMIELQKKTNADYVENIDAGLPRGIGAEIFTVDALKKSWTEGKEQHHREHVDEYILENLHKFKTAKLPAEPWMKKDYRLTVDTKEDFKLIEEIYRRLYSGAPIEFKDVIFLLDKNPELPKINSHIVQKKVK